MSATAMAAAQEKAEMLIQKAEKKLKGMFSFGTGKFEEAAEMYGQAAKQFQLAKQFTKAAQQYEQVVDMQTKLGSSLECAMAYRQASVMYEKAATNSEGTPDECFQQACRCLALSKDLYASEGRLSECAKIAKKRAEIFEAVEILDSAIESYEEAMELFDGEDQKSDTRNCRLKIAEHAATLDTPDDYLKSIKMYETVADDSLDNNLLKWGVKAHYVHSLMCHLVLAANGLKDKNPDTVREMKGEYMMKDPTFEDTREDMLITGCVEAIDESDEDKFATAVAEYDDIKKLNSWETQILLRAKRGIEKPATVEEDDIC